MSEKKIIEWAFLERDMEVNSLGEKVAYTWTCSDQEETHVHSIECLWVWHDCDQNLQPEMSRWVDPESGKKLYVGWTPTGVGAHTLIQIDPLHIEASVYWPKCCGLHGWIREGKWVDA